MKYRIGYVNKQTPSMLYVHAPNSYEAFKAAVEMIESGQALECIVYIADGNEWVKVANVRKD
jgi:hypothetical protein